MPRRVVVKRKCCDDKPRCRSCPKVWDRLASCGWAVQTDLREFVVIDGPIPDTVMKKARKRRARPLPRPS
jgi:hypothetical protein